MTVPDKEGPTNSFTAGRMEGYMTLDSVRATLAFSKLNLSKNTRVAGYGYSGGAITLGWASSLKPSYAPELNVIGWAYGGTPSNLSGTINHIDNTVFSGIILSGLTGIRDVYPKIREYLSSVLNAAGRRAIEFCHRSCLQEIILRYPFRSIYSYDFQTRGPRIFDEPVVQELFTELTMGLKAHETPDAPVFMYHAQQDEIVPYGDAHTRLLGHGVGMARRSSSTRTRTRKWVISLQKLQEVFPLSASSVTCSTTSQYPVDVSSRSKVRCFSIPLCSAAMRTRFSMRSWPSLERMSVTRLVFLRPRGRSSKVTRK